MSGTVVVACKIPTGLILRICRPHEEMEQGPGGQVNRFKISRPYGPEVVINGNGCPIGETRSYRIVGAPYLGYALTENVDADFWEEWLNQNRETNLVLNHMIWALDKPDDAAAKAKEMRGIRSGLEPVNQAGDPRAPKGIKNYNKKDDE